MLTGTIALFHPNRFTRSVWLPGLSASLTAPEPWVRVESISPNAVTSASGIGVMDGSTTLTFRIP